MRDFDPEVQAGGKEGHARMRDACERALTAGGLHVTGACVALGLNDICVSRLQGVG